MHSGWSYISSLEKRHKILFKSIVPNIFLLQDTLISTIAFVIVIQYSNDFQLPRSTSEWERST